MKTESQNSYTLFEAIAFYMPQGFVTNFFLIFIVYEVKNFAANNNQSSCQSQSSTEIHAKKLVIEWRFVQQRKEVYYNIKFNWVFEQMLNCRLVFWDSPGQW